MNERECRLPVACFGQCCCLLPGKHTDTSLTVLPLPLEPRQQTPTNRNIPQRLAKAAKHLASKIQHTSIQFAQTGAEKLFPVAECSVVGLSGWGSGRLESIFAVTRRLWTTRSHSYQFSLWRSIPFLFLSLSPLLIFFFSLLTSSHSLFCSVLSLLMSSSELLSLSQTE